MHSFSWKPPVLRSVVAVLVLGLPGPGGLAAQAPAGRDSTRPQSLGELRVETRRARTAPQDRLGASAVAGSRLGIPVREIPASVEVLTQDQLQDRGARTFLEAVTATAGATGGQPGGAPGSLALRGFTGNGVRYLYDGVVLGSATMTIRPMDSWGFERVEVIRGAASVLFGEGALGGAVNLVNRRPTRQFSGVDLLVAGGNLGRGRFGMGLGGPVTAGGTLAGRLDVSGNTAGLQQSLTRQQLGRLTGSLAFQPSARFEALVEADLFRDGTANAYWGSPTNPDGTLNPALARVNFNTLTDGAFDARTDWGRVKTVFRPSAQLTWRQDLYLADAYREWRNIENVALRAADPTVATRSSFGDLDHQQRTYGTRGELAYAPSIGGRTWRVLVGGELNRTTFGSQRNGFPGTQDVPALAPPAVAFTGVSGVVTRRPGREADVTQAAAFSELLVPVTASVKLVAAARADRLDLDFRYFDLTPIAQRDAVPDSAVSQRWSPVTGRVGLVVEATAGTTLYGQWGTATEPVGTLWLLTLANRSFDLTRGRQFEVGAKQQLPGGRGDVTLALYDINRRNILSRDPADPTVVQAIGRQSARGIELSAAVQAAPGVLLEGNAAYTRARFDDFTELVAGAPVSRVGNRPVNVPAWVTNIGTRWSVVPGVEVGGWFRSVGAVAMNTANDRTLAGWRTVDLFGSVDVDRRTTVTARVRNVFDALYANWVVTPGQVMLGDPRTLEVMVQLRGLGVR